MFFWARGVTRSITMTLCATSSWILGISSRLLSCRAFRSISFPFSWPSVSSLKPDSNCGYHHNERRPLFKPRWAVSDLLVGFPEPVPCVVDVLDGDPLAHAGHLFARDVRPPDRQAPALALVPDDDEGVLPAPRVVFHDAGSHHVRPLQDVLDRARVDVDRRKEGERLVGADEGDEQPVLLHE